MSSRICKCLNRRWDSYCRALPERLLIYPPPQLSPRSHEVHLPLCDFRRSILHKVGHARGDETNNSLYPARSAKAPAPWLHSRITPARTNHRHLRRAMPEYSGGYVRHHRSLLMPLVYCWSHVHTRLAQLRAFRRHHGPVAACRLRLVIFTCKFKV